MDDNLVRLYRREASYRVDLGGVTRDFPIVGVSPHLWIASNAEFILGDVQLISRAAELLERKVRRKRAEIVLTAEAKSIALAYELAKRLGHGRFVVARKSLKSYMGNHIMQPLKSITTDREQELLLTKEETSCLAGRRVCLLDDVVSTGGTFRALETLVKKAGGTSACRATIWREGPWYKDPELVFLEVLPVFVDSGSPLFSLARIQARSSRGTG